jgi:hypothetical protein
MSRERRRRWALFTLPDRFTMADMFREDVHAARREWLEEAKCDADEVIRREQSDFLLAIDEGGKPAKNHVGQILDFHALRHTCGAWLVLAGISLNVVQKVMRHSTITLTIDTYGHMLPGAEAQAVDGLAGFFSRPETETIAVLKTGTDGATIQKGAVSVSQKSPEPREPHARDTHGTAEIDEENAPCWN